MNTIKCQWFGMCANEAINNIAHPILGQVPTCERCTAKVVRLSDGRAVVTPIGDQS